MLISKFATDITINSSNYKHFKALGYDVEDGVLYNIPIEHMMKNSHIDVLVRCDNCGAQKIMMYKTYNTYNDNYFCRKCAEIKRKKTLMENYQVEYPAQNKEIAAQIKDTIMKNYGYENISQVPEFKNIKHNHQTKKKSP